MTDSRSEIETVAVVGAGTMGAGIAQVAAMGGFETLLFDPVAEARATARGRIDGSLGRGADRGFWSGAEAEAGLANLSVVDRLADLAGADLVIEAVPESLELKQALFAELAGTCGPDTLLATNTSSLSVTAIAGGIDRPQRFLGLHFFNPAPAMRLVEVVSGALTSPGTADLAFEAIGRMGKVAIRAQDAIGFVANRCARPYTLEGLRVSGDLGIDPAEIDRICRIGAGFPMGPFELIDLVGADINLAVAKSFHEQSFGLPRWQPSQMQVKMVDAGRLGRKTGRGFYEYGDGPHREPDPEIDETRPVLDRDRLIELAGPNAPEVLDRIAAQIVNEAVFTLAEGIATERDIDIAMLNGFNWPVGPIDWGRRIGFGRVLATLERLREIHGEAYLPSPLLRKMVGNTCV
ncbi:MAG TPA: 3-hydroxyacyl-CoA dehydrogenase NAD-binding domain-containing protein [Solirubrobacterales bacterium]|nr:3-hydroxyacyl-CoA dehydrogenase NAD-binding domain-containing protein [Solirubrobacterales bacterium]